MIFRWLAASAYRHFLVVGAQEKKKAPQLSHFKKWREQINLQYQKVCWVEWAWQRECQSKSFSSGSSGVITWGRGPGSKSTVASVSERQQNKQTCLSISVVRGDDLLLAICRILVPGDLHHPDVSGRCVATGQDRLLLCQGTYGVAWRKLHKFSPYHWNWKKKWRPGITWRFMSLVRNITADCNYS